MHEKEIKRCNFVWLLEYGLIGWAVHIFIVVDVGFASIHYSKYRHAHPLPDHILAIKQKFPSFIL